MTTNVLLIQAIGALVCGGIGAVIGFLVIKRARKSEIESAKKYKEKTINEAHRQAKTIA